MSWEPSSTCSTGAQDRNLLKLLSSPRRADVGLGHMISTRSPISSCDQCVREAEKKANAVMCLGVEHLKSLL